MKKLFLMLSAAMFSFVASAATEFVAGITWTYTINYGEASISGAKPASGAITIPSTLGGYPVTSIGDYAFEYCSGLTSVTIPSSVTNIGYEAFMYCSGLTSVVMLDGVTSIGSRAFLCCYELTSVTMPSSLRSIGNQAFEMCHSLASVTIPEGVTSIGEYAFYDCYELASVSIPSSVTNIDMHAFSWCSGLKEVHISDLAAWCKVKFNNDGDCSNPLQYARHLYLDDNEITELVIPDGVTSIGDMVFYNCIGLTSVTIPASVTSIGDSAFYGCKGLTSVTIPSSVTSIGSYAFSYCRGLGDGIVIANGCVLTVNGTCPSVVELSDDIRLIAGGAFSGCTDLTSMTIPSNVTNIGSQAFCYCSGLMEFVVDSANPAYCSINGLLLTKDGKKLIVGVNGDVVIPVEVTHIGDSAFCGCSELTSVTIPSSVTSIADWAFYECSGLTSVTIPPSVASIGEGAFMFCSGLTSVTIPSSVTSIGDHAFYFCENLKTVYVQAGEVSRVKAMLESSGLDVTDISIVPASATETITLLNSDAWNQAQSFTEATTVSAYGTFPCNWSDGKSPHTGADYLVEAPPNGELNLMTMSSKGEYKDVGYTFGGDSLTLVGSDLSHTARLYVWFSSSLYYYQYPLTINDFRLGKWGKVALENSSKQGFNLYGKLTINGTPEEPALLEAKDAGSFFNIYSKLVGAEAAGVRIYTSFNTLGDVDRVSLNLYGDTTEFRGTIVADAFGKVNLGDSGLPNGKIVFGSPLCTLSSESVKLASVKDLDASAGGVIKILHPSEFSFGKLTLGAGTVIDLNEFADDKSLKSAIMVTGELVQNGAVGVDIVMPYDVEKLAVLTTAGKIPNIDDFYLVNPEGCALEVDGNTLWVVNTSSEYFDSTGYVKLTRSDPKEATLAKENYSYHYAGGWENGLWPEDTNDYFVASGRLMNLITHNIDANGRILESVSIERASGNYGAYWKNIKFYGRSLTVAGTLYNKSPSDNTGYSLSIADLRMRSGSKIDFSDSEYDTVFNWQGNTSKLTVLATEKNPFVITGRKNAAKTFYCYNRLIGERDAFMKLKGGSGAFAFAAIDGKGVNDYYGTISVGEGLTLYLEDAGYFNGTVALEAASSTFAFATFVTAYVNNNTAKTPRTSGKFCLYGLQVANDFSWDANGKDFDVKALAVGGDLTIKGVKALPFPCGKAWEIGGALNLDEGAYIDGTKLTDNISTESGIVVGKLGNRKLVFDFTGTSVADSVKKFRIVALPNTASMADVDVRGLSERYKLSLEDEGAKKTLYAVVKDVAPKPDGGPYTEVVDGIEWTYKVKGGKAIVGDESSSLTAIPTSTTGAITIPSTLGGHPVTAIDDNAFRSCIGLTSVTIPSSVTSIGWYAFYDCSGLASVMIPEGVTSIGDLAFYGCSSLASVTIPSSVTSIGLSAFSGCRGFGNGIVVVNGCLLMVNGTCPSVVELSNDIRLIAGGAFSGCTGLTSVTIPSSVMSIGRYAFNRCRGLTSVTIPSSVTVIGHSAFRDCTGLTSVTIPSSVKSIGYYAFDGCSKLKTVVTETNDSARIKALIYPALSGVVFVERQSSAVVPADVTGGKAIEVEPSWAAQYPAFAAKFGDDLAAALIKKTGKKDANGDEMAVWQDYVAGTDPTDPESQFKASVEFVEGKPVVKWSPDLGNAREYKIYGKRKLNGGDWYYPTNSWSKFFKVKVSMPGDSDCSEDKPDPLGDNPDEPVQKDDKYLILDLSAGSNAASYPITLLAEEPSGGWTDEYKTTKLVLRRIEAGSFKMGSPTGEVGRYSEETQHSVTISKPFYIGVFEVTQKQWELVMGTKPSYFSNASYYATRPVEQVSYNMIRGSSSGSGWPNSSAVDSTSFLGKIRAKTGLSFDLPTEAQWEYACRAGTTTALNSGKNLASTSQDANMDAVGRYWYNFPSGNTSYSSTSTLSAGTAAVGSYKPNNWGLYDMHGNVWEWCLDWYVSNLGTSSVTDPNGASSGSNRVYRGGGWNYIAGYCRSAYRSFNYPSGESYINGFRLCCSAGQQ